MPVFASLRALWSFRARVAALLALAFADLIHSVCLAATLLVPEAVSTPISTPVSAVLISIPSFLATLQKLSVSRFAGIAVLLSEIVSFR